MFEHPSKLIDVCFQKFGAHFLCLKGYLQLFCVSLLARNSFSFYVSVFMELVRFELGCHQMWGMSATVAADVISDPFPMSSFCRGSNQRYPGCLLMVPNALITFSYILIPLHPCGLFQEVSPV